VNRISLDIKTTKKKKKKGQYKSTNTKRSLLFSLPDLLFLHKLTENCANFYMIHVYITNTFIHQLYIAIHKSVQVSNGNHIRTVVINFCHFQKACIDRNNTFTLQHLLYHVLIQTGHIPTMWITGENNHENKTQTFSDNECNIGQQQCFISKLYFTIQYPWSPIRFLSS
jgi:hypothetical protein